MNPDHLLLRDNSYWTSGTKLSFSGLDLRSGLLIRTFGHREFLCTQGQLSFRCC
jgi:hypothetical protein